MVVDALDGVTEQDQRLAGRIEQEGRACLIVVNKWDAVEKDSHTMSAMEKDIRSKLYFLDWAEMIFTSALTGQRVEGIFALATLAVDQNRRRAAENYTQGTDHGTAAPHFLLGGAVKGGFWGVHPDLGNLNEGDMIFTMDYRSVYERILSDWFMLRENKFLKFRNDELKDIFRNS